MKENKNQKGRKYKILPLSEKKKAVDLFKTGEVPIAEIAKQFGVNPGTITQQWVKQVERGVDRLVGGYKMPSDEYRLKVVRTVLSGNLTIEEAAKAYGIVEPITITKWIKKFNSEIASGNDLSLMKTTDKKRGRKPKKQQEQTCQSNSLDQALEDAKLKILALETMITVAEQQF